LTGANAHAVEPKPIPFVMQMTAGDSGAQRRAFLQIAKVLEDICHGLKEEDFPIEVDFVPAGAPEMVGLQMKGYRYWRP
jgi:hypothetical protein